MNETLRSFSLPVVMLAGCGALLFLVVGTNGESGETPGGIELAARLVGSTLVLGAMAWFAVDGWWLPNEFRDRAVVERARWRRILGWFVGLDGIATAAVLILAAALADGAGEALLFVALAILVAAATTWVVRRTVRPRGAGSP